MLQLAKAGELVVPKNIHINPWKWTLETKYQHLEVDFRIKYECSSDREIKRKSKDSTTKATVNTKDMVNMIKI